MQKIKNYFHNSTHSIDPTKLKSGCLRRLFNIKSNNIVATINKHNSHSLLIILELKCSKNELLLISHLLLTIIKINFPALIKIKNHQIFLGTHPISTAHHHHSSQSGVICHSISLRPSEKEYSVGHLDISAKNFSIEILNEFSDQLNDILIHNKDLK